MSSKLEKYTVLGLNALSSEYANEHDNVPSDLQVAACVKSIFSLFYHSCRPIHYPTIFISVAATEAPTPPLIRSTRISRRFSRNVIHRSL
jgi:hypothetical protein